MIHPRGYCLIVCFFCGFVYVRSFDEENSLLTTADNGIGGFSALHRSHLNAAGNCRALLEKLWNVEKLLPQLECVYEKNNGNF